MTETWINSDSNKIHLAYTLWNYEIKPAGNEVAIVLLHGLDSTQSTWSNTISILCEEWKKLGRTNMNTAKLKVLALDLRGHGESPLGDWRKAFADSDARQIVQDIRSAVHERIGARKKFVLVGHSAGGRVAMKYAAHFPSDLISIFIEDIDVKPRPFPPAMTCELMAFEPTFDFKDDLFSCLESFGYARDRLEGWVGSRIYERQVGNKRVWFTGVSPLSQHQMRQHILAKPGSDFFTLASNTDLPVTLLVAGKMSACDKESLREMIALCPRAQVYQFPDSGHSIHREFPKQFCKVIIERIAATTSFSPNSTRTGRQVA